MQSPRLCFIITIKLKNEEEAAQLDSLFSYYTLIDVCICLNAANL